MENKFLRVKDMDTKHLFNTMKMLFNHLAINIDGLTPVWFQHQYPGFMRQSIAQPSVLAETCMRMLFVLCDREIPVKYKEPLEDILGQLRGMFGHLEVVRELGGRLCLIGNDVPGSELDLGK